MDYEKAYKNALNRAKEYHFDGAKQCITDTLEYIFPELKESKDETIRKEIIEFVDINTLSVDERHDRWIAWLEKQCYTKKDIDDAYLKGICDAKHELEKQGEQKPADKVESKFKIGDWITDGEAIFHVIDYIEHVYQLVTQSGTSFHFSDVNVENKYHLWTIQDAKDGDVLIGSGNVKYSNGIKYERIYLFNNFDNAYFTLTKYSNHVEEYDIDVNVDYPDNTVPATKKQKEILFMAMKGAGYEWDVEKKRLKKIEQKPVVIIPKFHKGEWIVWKNKCYKVNYNGCGYELIDQNGLSTWLEYGTVDTSARLYDVAKDAKDGDVLADNGAKIIFIFKNIEYDSHIESNVIKYFIRYSFDGINLPLENGGHLGVVGEYSNFVPATKEQRDTLEKAMADAGYTFDFEKKELKKIEDEIEIPFGAKDSELQEETYYIPKGFHAEIDDDKVVIKKGEKPVAWSDEDRDLMYDTLSNLTELKDLYGKAYGNVGKCIDWLKSLKDRVQPKPKEWGEEDENYLQSAENACEYQYGKNTSTILWLKSLKERNTWKPSKEQMEALDDALNERGFDYNDLNSLYEQLKKL